MAYKTTAETAPYTKKKPHPVSTSGCSYTPSANINEFAYGKDGGKAAFANPPEVVVGGASVAQAPPAMPGTLTIGADKNVSTPVSG